MKIDFVIDKTGEGDCSLTISEMSWNEFDRVRLLLQSIYKYAPTLIENVDPFDLSMDRVVYQIAQKVSK